jgi:hypothetical protein
MEEKKDNLNYFNGFLKKTTIHGLYNIKITKNIFLKTIWMISILVSTSLCGYSIMNSIDDYLSFEVMTKIREINEVKSIFPTISICNRNMFTSKYAFEYLKNYSESKNLKETLIEPEFDILRSNSFLRNAMSNFLYFEKNIENRKRLSHSLKEILISCTFNQRKCDDSNFEWFHHYQYGNCYKFIPSSIHGNEVIIPGKLNGLTIEMYIGVYNELDAIRETKGISLIVSNKSDYVNDMDGLFLFSGTENDVVIKRKFSELLPYPYSNCHDNFNEVSETIQMINYNNYSYSYRLCMKICLQKQISEICKCYDSKSIPLNNFRICYDDKDISCLNEIYGNVSSLIAFNENCYGECPFECAKSELLASIAISRYPTSNQYAGELLERYIKRVNQNISFQEIWDNVLKFNVFYDVLTYTSITETPSMNTISILSNIGGTLGLFLGIN